VVDVYHEPQRAAGQQQQTGQRKATPRYGLLLENTLSPDRLADFLVFSSISERVAIKEPPSPGGLKRGLFEAENW
jgi:hypothetical protein